MEPVVAPVEPKVHSLLRQKLDKKEPKQAAAAPASAAPVVVAPQTATPTPPQTPAPQTAVPVAEPAPVVAKPKLSHEELIALLNEETGGSYTSLDDLKPKPKKTKEEIEAEEQQFRTEALEWALSTGQVKKEDYDRSVVDKSKSNREIALRLFAEEQRLDDPKIGDDEIEELFKDLHHEDKEPDSRLYKTGQKKIEAIAKGYIKENYGTIDGVEDAFKESRTTRDRYINFNKGVKETIEALPRNQDIEVDYVHANGKSEKIKVAYTIDDKDIANLKKIFSDEGMFHAIGASKGEVPQKEILKAITHHLEASLFKKALAEVAKNSADRATLDTMAYLKGFQVPQAASSISPAVSLQNTRDQNKPQEHSLLRAAMSKK